MKDAGRRWIAEIVFSSIKEILREEFRSRESRYMTESYVIKQIHNHIIQ